MLNGIRDLSFAYYWISTHDLAHLRLEPRWNPRTRIAVCKENSMKPRNVKLAKFILRLQLYTQRRKMQGCLMLLEAVTMSIFTTSALYSAVNMRLIMRYAKKYIYSFSTRRRVYKWADLNVRVWI